MRRTTIQRTTKPTGITIAEFISIPDQLKVTVPSTRQEISLGTTEPIVRACLTTTMTTSNTSGRLLPIALTYTQVASNGKPKDTARRKIIRHTCKRIAQIPATSAKKIPKPLATLRATQTRLLLPTLPWLSTTHGTPPWPTQPTLLTTRPWPTRPTLGTLQ